LFENNIIIKALYFAAGLFFVLLGLVGIVIPGLPTTIFMILAAACFFRSSTKMYDWVINHPLFGESVLRFRSGEGIPIKAKYTSIIMMWFFISTSIFFFLHSHALWIKAIITISGFIGTIFILRQPTFKKV
tara:strand:- start:3916 stop:4308 length:393 start_codon:yes stop_codon:yes gene_type:complete